VLFPVTVGADHLAFGDFSKDALIAPATLINQF
jgi:hypothetical protein